MGLARGLVSAAASALAAVLVLGLLQTSTASFAGNDDFYHVGWSRHIAEEGLKGFPPSFPWLPHTVLNERDYSDHHLLYHVLLSFFVKGDARVGGKVAAVVFASAALAVFGWLLARWSVPYPLLWVLVLLAGSHPFLYRLSMVRAQSASLAFLLLAAAWADARRMELLFLLSVLYVWLYDAFPLFFAVIALRSLAGWLVRRRFAVRPLIVTAAGVASGLLLHPYFPSNIKFTYRHLMEKLAPAAPVPVGGEWAPYDSGFLFSSSALLFIVLGSALLVSWLRERKPTERELFVLLLAAVFLLMAVVSRRFIEYFPAFACLAAATLAGPPLAEAVRKRKLVALIGLILLLGGAGASNFLHAKRTLAARPPFDRYAGAARWLAENTPAGSIVWTSDWDDFPQLFYFNRHNRYVVGLDPTFSLLYDKNGFYRWVEMTRGDLDDVEELIELWDAHYAFTDRRHRAFFRAMEKLPGAERVYQDRFTLVYWLGS